MSGTFISFDVEKEIIFDMVRWALSPSLSLAVKFNPLGLYKNRRFDYDHCHYLFLSTICFYNIKTIHLNQK